LDCTGRRLEAVDLTGSFWVDVDTPDDARRAERLIVARAASKPLDGLVSRRLNRPLSRRVSLLLVRAGVSPTAVTLGTFAFTLVAAVVVAFGAVSVVALAAGGLLVQLASIVDGCDGEVARATLRTSRFGALLDTMLDRVADAALLVALAVAAGLRATTWAALTAALFAALFVPYVRAAYESTARAALPATRASYGRDGRLLTIALCAIVLQPFTALVAVAIVSAIEAVARSAAALRAAHLP
jgi:CDP-L-myo-inositol myo-inositolphosphotransferase